MCGILALPKCLLAEECLRPSGVTASPLCHFWKLRHKVKCGWGPVSVATRRKRQLRKLRKKSVWWMQTFVHVCYSRADRSDAITWHGPASLPSKKSHPVYLMQTATVHSSSTCTVLPSFFIWCLSWKSCQAPVSSLDLYCKQDFEQLRGSFGVSWARFCRVFSHDESLRSKISW